GSHCIEQDEGESKFLQTHDSIERGNCYFDGSNDAERSFIAGHSAATIFVFSKALPTGAGYFLHDLGAAGGGNAAPAVVAAAAAKQTQPPQVDPQKLRNIWSTGTRR